MSEQNAKVEELKKKGNECFQNNDTAQAIQYYTNALLELNRGGRKTLLEATLLSNRAACRLKQHSTNIDDSTLLEDIVDDCTRALNCLENADSKESTEQSISSLRCKLLYRRAKARFLAANRKDTSDSSTFLNDAAKDLLHLLNLDPNNGEASKLLRVIRTQHGLQQHDHTPVAKTLHAIFNAADRPDQAHHFKVLLGLLSNDLVSTSMELGRRGGVEQIFAFAVDPTNAKDGEAVKCRTLALQTIACACSHPPFCQAHGHAVDQAQLAEIVVEESNTSSSVAVAALSVLLRLVLHLDFGSEEKDDDKIDSISQQESKVNDHAVSRAIVAAFDSGHHTVIRTALDILSSWTSTDREGLVHAAVDNVYGQEGQHATAKLLPHKPTQSEIRSMKPRELAVYRKREYRIKERDAKWAKKRSFLFCSGDENGMKSMLKFAVSCPHHALRRETGLVLGRLFASLDDDEDVKSVVTPILQSSASNNDENMEEEFTGLTIEEIHDDDEEKDATQENDTERDEGVDVGTHNGLESVMEKAQLTCALLLGKSDVGTWALQTGWSGGNGLGELRQLMLADDNAMAMCIAAEVLSGAASVEKGRPLVSPLINSPAFSNLLQSEEQEVQSGAASAIAKMGLADKELSNNEGEVMGLLQVAVQLLTDKSADVDNGVLDMSSSALDTKLSWSSSTTAVERGIELLSYLASKTIVKEELAFGFKAFDSPLTALQQLVALSSAPGAGESASAYGLATIFALIPVSIETLRREAFVGKDITAEQYDQLQALGKTEEEKELESKTNLDDEPQAVQERIRKMASDNVPRAIVKLMEGARELTLEQLVLAANRMAIEESVRGSMVQQGILSSCIKLEKEGDEDPSESGKKILRHSRQCIAKLLISTNPSLLTTSQRMGAIKPLLLLIRDSDALDLQHFEALLAVTNLASVGDETKNRIVAERGISTLSYAMFSDHEMVRRAATEAMCNLVPHVKMMEHLADPENLKLWVAFAADYEENYECARASAGCLAMAVQHEPVANALVDLKSFKDMSMTLLESGKLELMHRVLIMILNLTSQGDKCRDAVVSSGVRAFCAAYVDSYHDGSRAEDLDLSAADRQLMDVTVDIAKDIVSDMR